MRELDVQCIADKIAQLCVEANHYLGEDIKACIRQKAEEETWPVAKDVLASIEENIAIAEEGVFPLCQDTGMACVFLEIGQDVHLTGGLLEDAVNEGVRRGYREGYLRKSIVEAHFAELITRVNTPACTPYGNRSGRQGEDHGGTEGFWIGKHESYQDAPALGRGRRGQGFRRRYLSAGRS